MEASSSSSSDAALITSKMEKLNVTQTNGHAKPGTDDKGASKLKTTNGEVNPKMKIKKMTRKERKYLMYLVLKEGKEFCLDMIVDDHSVDDLAASLNCSLCGKWVKDVAAMCMSGHLTCGPHARIVGSCTFETPGDIEKGPITDFGVPCGRRFYKSYPVYVRIFYGIVEMLKKTGGDVGECKSKDEKKDMNLRLMGITDDYIKQLIEWGKTKI